MSSQAYINQISTINNRRDWNILTQLEWDHITEPKKLVWSELLDLLNIFVQIKNQYKQVGTISQSDILIINDFIFQFIFLLTLHKNDIKFIYFPFNASNNPLSIIIRLSHFLQQVFDLSIDSNIESLIYYLTNECT